MKKLDVSINRLVAALVVLFPMTLAQNAFAVASSTTTLTISSASVSSGTPVTLTAAVVSNSAPVMPGLVTFCDATATYCEGPAMLAMAQLTASDTASVKLLFGVGSHSVKAVFAGTASIPGGASAAEPITVTGLLPTDVAVSSTGAAGAYALSATLSYHGLTASAAEELSFLDTSNSNNAWARRR